MDAFANIPGKKIKSYTFAQKLGTGSFSQVWLANDGISCQDVAIKIIPKTKANRKMYKNEIAIMKAIDHPLIVKFFENFCDDEFYYIVMEYVPGGSLMDLVNNDESSKLDEFAARKYFTQLFVVLEYLHNTVKVVHRDLKIENVLLDCNNNIRLIDFGLSVFLTSPDQEFSERCGSPEYISPEMVRENSYTSSVDVWSVGIILFALVTGSLPFTDETTDKIMDNVVYKELEYPRNLSPPLVQLLQKMLNKSPVGRIDIEAVKEQPWFSKTEYLLISRLNTINLTTILSDDDTFILENINTDIFQNNVGVGTKKNNESIIQFNIISNTRRAQIIDEIIQGNLTSVQGNRRHSKTEIKIKKTKLLFPTSVPKSAINRRKSLVSGNTISSSQSNFARSQKSFRPESHELQDEMPIDLASQKNSKTSASNSSSNFFLNPSTMSNAIPIPIGARKRTGSRKFMS